MHLTVCFEASRLTLTQSSWTTPRPGCSRQWMSGYAAVALVAPRDRGPFTNLNLTTLGEPVPPSEGESPFPLDFYLSWMSPFFPPRWHEQIGDPTIADGILDRLVHNADRIEMRGESMRKKRNPPQDEKKE